MELQAPHNLDTKVSQDNVVRPSVKRARAGDALYAVYRPMAGRDPAEYWPVGEYALLFERQMNNLSLPVTAFVQDGKLVRLGASHPVDPAQSLSAISLDRILIPPEEAEALMGQVKSPS